MSGSADYSQAEAPIINIDGMLITLGPITTDFVPIVTRWMNDFDAALTRAPIEPRPFMFEQERQWIESLTSSGGREFLIRERATGDPIGTTGLSDIDHRNRSAVFGINIGQRNARGKGYGTEASRLILDYAFTMVGLHSVSLGVAEFNVAGIRAYQRAGFRESGRWRQRWLMGGKLWDYLIMDCLATEFDRSVLAERFMRPLTPNGSSNS